MNNENLLNLNQNTPSKLPWTKEEIFSHAHGSFYDAKHGDSKTFKSDQLSSEFLFSKNETTGLECKFQHSSISSPERYDTKIYETEIVVELNFGDISSSVTYGATNPSKDELMTIYDNAEKTFKAWCALIDVKPPEIKWLSDVPKKIILSSHNPVDDEIQY